MGFSFLHFDQICFSSFQGKMARRSSEFILENMGAIVGTIWNIFLPNGSSTQGLENQECGQILLNMLESGKKVYICRTPPNATPPRNKALLRDYQPLVSLNKALLGPYFFGKRGLGGAPSLNKPWESMRFSSLTAPLSDLPSVCSWPSLISKSRLTPRFTWTPQTHAMVICGVHVQSLRCGVPSKGILQHITPFEGLWHFQENPTSSLFSMNYLGDIHNKPFILKGVCIPSKYARFEVCVIIACSDGHFWMSRYPFVLWLLEILTGMQVGRMNGMMGPYQL